MNLFPMTVHTRTYAQGSWFDNDWNAHIENGRWSIDLPEDLEPLRKEIEECINENIPYGCCGGCV